MGNGWPRWPATGCAVCPGGRMVTSAANDIGRSRTRSGARVPAAGTLGGRPPDGGGHSMATTTPPRRSGIFAIRDVGSLTAEAHEEGHELKRAVGPWQLTAMGVGAIIGTGIFVVIGE